MRSKAHRNGGSHCEVALQPLLSANRRVVCVQRHVAHAERLGPQPPKEEARQEAKQEVQGVGGVLDHDQGLGVRLKLNQARVCVLMEVMVELLRALVVALAKDKEEE